MDWGLTIFMVFLAIASVITAMAYMKKAAVNNCVMSPWTKWSDCDKSCGGGTIVRTRTVVTEATNGGTCGKISESATCNTQACNPVNCTRSPWSPWSACSAQCGGGKATRDRTITKQGSGGGLACDPSVPLHEEKVCNDVPCTCSWEWIGDKCQYPHCYHGVPNANKTCTCYPNWKGSRCEQINCFNNGSAVPSDASKPNIIDKCNCSPPWTGEFCGLPQCINGHPSDSCLNGNCPDTKCICNRGWSGPKCEVPSCQNGGTLVDGRCACPSKWGGNMCENNLCDAFGQPDEKGESCICKGIASSSHNDGICDQTLCVHGQPNDERTACTCDPAYMGVLCDKSACQNGGTPTSDGKKCTCPSGYTGKLCEIDACNQKFEGNDNLGNSCRCNGPNVTGLHCDTCRPPFLYTQNYEAWPGMELKYNSCACLPARSVTMTGANCEKAYGPLFFGVGTDMGFKMSGEIGDHDLHGTPGLGNSLVVTTPQNIGQGLKQVWLDVPGNMCDVLKGAPDYDSNGWNACMFTMVPAISNFPNKLQIYHPDFLPKGLKNPVYTPIGNMTIDDCTRLGGGFNPPSGGGGGGGGVGGVIDDVAGAIGSLFDKRPNPSPQHSFGIGLPSLPSGVLPVTSAGGMLSGGVFQTVAPAGGIFSGIASVTGGSDVGGFGMVTGTSVAGKSMVDSDGEMVGEDVAIITSDAVVRKDPAIVTNGDTSTTIRKNTGFIFDLSKNQVFIKGTTTAVNNIIDGKITRRDNGDVVATYEGTAVLNADGSRHIADIDEVTKDIYFTATFEPTEEKVFDPNTDTIIDHFKLMLYYISGKIIGSINPNTGNVINNHKVVGTVRDNRFFYIGVPGNKLSGLLAGVFNGFEGGTSGFTGVKDIAGLKPNADGSFKYQVPADMIFTGSADLAEVSYSSNEMGMYRVTHNPTHTKLPVNDGRMVSCHVYLDTVPV